MYSSLVFIEETLIRDDVDGLAEIYTSSFLPHKILRSELATEIHSRMIHLDPSHRMILERELLATVREQQRRQQLAMALPSLRKQNTPLAVLQRSAQPKDLISTLIMLEQRQSQQQLDAKNNAEQFFLKHSHTDILPVSTTPRPSLKRPFPATVSRSSSPSPHDSSSSLRSEASEGSKKTLRKKDGKWLSSLEQLKEYQKKHGDCIVPRGYAENPRLASWVAEQRKQYKLMKDGKQSSITPERVLMLQELGFSWNAQEAAWTRHMKDLKQFRAETGHCHVPLNHEKYPKLGLWIKEQRRHYTLMKQGKQSHMTDERKAELEAVGMCWDTHEATWLERLRELSNFRERYGTCIVPTNYVENPKLGTWVHHQRRQYKKFKEGKACHITEDRIQALENLGFVWNPREKHSSSNNSVSDNSSVCSSDDSETDLESLDLRPRKRTKTA